MEISEEELIRIQEKIDKLKQSKFKQQMLPAWRPVPSFGSTMVIFGLFGLLFLSLGVTLFVMSENIAGFTLKYKIVRPTRQAKQWSAKNISVLPATSNRPFTSTTNWTTSTKTIAVTSNRAPTNNSWATTSASTTSPIASRCEPTHKWAKTPQ